VKPIRPFEPYKIDAKFGEAVSYGPHEGGDYNGLSRGNTDCGTPYRAAWDGEVVHSGSSNAGYGKMVVLRVVLPTTTGKVTRFIRYCHCSEFVITSGSVKRGEIIAKMGSTGNSTACHLHLDVLKKQPTNWRFYAKTRAELDEWFEDPEIFFNGIITTGMSQWLTELLKEELGLDTSKSEGDIRARVGDLKSIVNGYDDLVRRVEKIEEDYITSVKESEGTKAALELEQENRMRVERERESLKNQLANKDTEIRKLESKIATLEANNTPTSQHSAIERIIDWLFRRS